MSAVAEVHRNLARSLPFRLQKFFALNPPRMANGANLIPAHVPSGTDATLEQSPASATTAKERRFMNPFEPHKNPKTGCWNPPIYSLRRQAELVKLAKKHGVEELLPFTIKKTEEKSRRREEHGLRVKGTGVGQRVKGHEWERTLKGRLEKRRQAMLQMPQLIQDWKQVRQAICGSSR